MEDVNTKIWGMRYAILVAEQGIQEVFAEEARVFFSRVCERVLEYSNGGSDFGSVGEAVHALEEAAHAWRSRHEYLVTAQNKTAAYLGDRAAPVVDFTITNKKPTVLATPRAEDDSDLDYETPHGITPVDDDVW